MMHLLLCRERLQRVQLVLERHGRTLSVRTFQQSYGVHLGEFEQAAALGWVCIETRKPRTGRPSRIVVAAGNLSKSEPRKLPLFRNQLPKAISPRHMHFAMRLTAVVPRRGVFGFDISSQVRAYGMTYPKAKSYAGACASASRLGRRPEVVAARTWMFAKSSGEIPVNEPMPPTAPAIYRRLAEVGNWRVSKMFARHQPMES